MGWFHKLKLRYQGLLAEFGSVAIGVYFVIFFGTWFGFWVAIGAGMEIEGTAAGMGRIGGAWAATKLTQPLRILATLGLTPPVAFVVRKLRGSSEPETPEGEL